LPFAPPSELATIRRRGWASSYEETNLGVWGVAVPALSARGDVTCAVGIAGPSARLTPARVRDDVERVHDAALAIARTLDLNVPVLSGTRSAITSKKPTTKESPKKERKG